MPYNCTNQQDAPSAQKWPNKQIWLWMNDRNNNRWTNKWNDRETIWMNEYLNSIIVNLPNKLIRRFVFGRLTAVLSLIPYRCVWFNSRNDVLRVAQRYGTMDAHTRRRASVLVMVVVCMCAHIQFCRFDKADATANVQWHCNHRPPLWYHYFPAQNTLGADILVYWIGKIVRTCAAGGSRTLDSLRERRTPYPLGHALRNF